MTMKREFVDSLESLLEETISEVLERLKKRELPLKPNRQTIHLMAKAAVTVYETAVENSR